MANPKGKNLADEEFWDNLDNSFVAMYGERAKKWLTLLEDIDPEDMIFEYVNEARAYGYSKGYAEGMADAELNEMEEQDG